MAIPTLLITGRPDPQLRRRAEALGVAVLEKPISGDRLLEAIEDAVDASDGRAAG